MYVICIGVMVAVGLNVTMTNDHYAKY